MAEDEISFSSDRPTSLPFPPLTKSHILNCSYHKWQPLSITPKARLIPLSDPFLSYLRADGIILPPDDDDEAQRHWSDSDSGIFSATDNENDNASSSSSEEEDVSASWRDIHESIKATIAELGGIVVPKLNWSAPKDATWINPTNSMECRSPADIYLMLKSSDFVTHDLEHAFDDTVDADAEAPQSQPQPSSSPATTATPQQTAPQIPYHLILRKSFQLNPSLEFRCFARNRRLLALCQRDLNHFAFLSELKDKLRDSIQAFFDARLRDSFPDPSFVFDVYVPPPHDRVWLIDVNPWAQRTDPLLFSWLEILRWPEVPGESEGEGERGRGVASGALPATSLAATQDGAEDEAVPRDGAAYVPPQTSSSRDPEATDSDSDEDAEEEIYLPEFRLVRKDDPEAYGFTTPQYSAHKLPRDVVDASRAGGSELREFAMQWKEALARAQREDEEASVSEGD